MQYRITTATGQGEEAHASNGDGSGVYACVETRQQSTGIGVLKRHGSFFSGLVHTLNFIETHHMVHK